MTLLESTLLVCTAVALLWTKALDVISTWRFIGVHGESNPIARWLFEKAGLAGGIAIVCALYILILAAQQPSRDQRHCSAGVPPAILPSAFDSFAPALCFPIVTRYRLLVTRHIGPAASLAARRSPLAARHSPLATRHSPLATRHSPLATRHSPLATSYQLLVTRYSLLVTRHHTSSFSSSGAQTFPKLTEKEQVVTICDYPTNLNF